jgi:hypothetical protein
MQATKETTKETEERIGWTHENCGGPVVNGTDQCVQKTAETAYLCRCQPAPKHDYRLLFILVRICLTAEMPGKLKRPHLYVKNESSVGEAYEYLHRMFFENEELRLKFPNLTEIKPSAIQKQLQGCIERYEAEHSISLCTAGRETHPLDARPETPFQEVVKAISKQRRKAISDNLADKEKDKLKHSNKIHFET